MSDRPSLILYKISKFEIQKVFKWWLSRPKKYLLLKSEIHVSVGNPDIFKYTPKKQFFNWIYKLLKQTETA